MNLFILHYGDDTLTNQTIRSLIDQDARLIVVDNGSPTPYANADVTVYRLSRNLYMIPAFAEAMRLYPSDVYGLLNNDLICASNLVRAIDACFDDPDVGIVAPGSSDRSTGVLYNPVPNQPQQNVVTTQVDNHCFFIHQAVIDEIGYPEVNEHTHRACWAWNRFYCYKARKVGFKVIAALQTYVVHLHEGGYNAEADKAGREWLKLRLGEQFAEAW